MSMFYSRDCKGYHKLPHLKRGEAGMRFPEQGPDDDLLVEHNDEGFMLESYQRKPPNSVQKLKVLRQTLINLQLKKEGEPQVSPSSWIHIKRRRGLSTSTYMKILKQLELERKIPPDNTDSDLAQLRRTRRSLNFQYQAFCNRSPSRSTNCSICRRSDVSQQYQINSMHLNIGKSVLKKGLPKINRSQLKSRPVNATNQKRSRSVSKSPYYKFCHTCNKKNQALAQQKIGLSIEHFQKLREDWQKDFENDYQIPSVDLVENKEELSKATGDYYLPEDTSESNGSSLWGCSFLMQE